MDPKVNGQIQDHWRWLIAIYLFLGGVGGGAYTIAAINSFLGEALEPSTIVGLWISFPALIIGSLCLLADLGQPMKAVLAGMRPGTSWISRGFWIISIFIVVAMAHTWLALFGNAGEGLLRIIAVIGIVFAVSTMAYTGILLGASKGITFWRSGVVPVIFVISAVVTGHFAIMIGLVLFNPAGGLEALRPMAAEAVALVVLEVLAIAFFLQMAWRHPDPRESAERLLSNTTFIVGYVMGGLVAPLVLMLLLYRQMLGESAETILAVSALGAALGLIGGLILRWGVLRFGALPTLNVAGFEFRRVARPKDPKANIGLLPPQ